MSKSYDSIHMMNHCVLDLPGLEGAGTKIHDRSKYRNNGAMTNVTWAQLASGLWMMGFNGTTSKINCGQNTSCRPSAFSLAIWIKSSGNTGNYQGFLTNSVWTHFYGYALSMSSSNYARMSAQSAGAGITLLSTGALSLSTWYLVVVTYDGTTAKLYIDSTLHDTDGPITVAYEADDVLMLGTFAGSPTAGNWFAGSLALPRIWNIALTAGQIKTLYDKERILFGV